MSDKANLVCAFVFSCGVSGVVAIAMISCSSLADWSTTYEDDHISVIVEDERGRKQEAKVLLFGNYERPRLMFIQYGPAGIQDPPISNRENRNMKVGGKRVFRPGLSCLVIAQMPNGTQEFSVPTEKAHDFVQSLYSLHGNIEFLNAVLAFVESETPKKNADGFESN